MSEQKSYRVDFTDEAGGGFQYLLLDSSEAKAWKALDSVKSVKAEEPPDNEPPKVELGDVVEAQERSLAIDAGLPDPAIRDMPGPQKEAAAKARKGREEAGRTLRFHGSERPARLRV
jgi:hypothetical protein